MGKNFRNCFTKIMKKPAFKEGINFCRACENLILTARYFIYLYSFLEIKLNSYRLQNWKKKSSV